MSKDKPSCAPAGCNCGTSSEDELAEWLVAGGERAQSTRRKFLKTVATATGAAAAAVGTPGCALTWEQFIQKHYLELTSDEKEALIARVERETKDRYGVDVEVKDPRPMEGVQFAYALNLSYCVGCRRCEYACAAENNTSRDPEVHYIRVLEMDKGTQNIEESEHYYEGTVPDPNKYYMPVQCHQCDNPPCVRACPVDATWKEEDGIVVVDYEWCIGCRYCEAACPYWARRFNFTQPKLRPSEVNPAQGLLSNRIRPQGVVEKCTYCLHRTREGKYPACLEVCPTGSRKFGNLLDPNSEVRRIIQEKRVFVFKEELGTIPRFFYFYD
jgi:molybdopterin-containing oxidoreductase family iron-sulfur binding subunit